MWGHHRGVSVIRDRVIERNRGIRFLVDLCLLRGTVDPKLFMQQAAKDCHFGEILISPVLCLNVQPMQSSLGRVGAGEYQCPHSEHGSASPAAGLDKKMRQSRPLYPLTFR